MSNQLDQILIQIYQKMLNVGNISNDSNNSYFNCDVYVNNNLYVYGLTELNGDTTINSNLYTYNNNNIFNNVTILSNLNISNYSILNNTIINSNLNTNDLSVNYLNISNYSIFNNNLSINSNLNISKDLFFNNGLYTNNINSINNLNINSNIINIGTTDSLINMYGSTLFIASDNLQISDKLLDLNINSNNSNGGDIGFLSGIGILGISGNGFITTSLDATKFLIKYPVDPNINYIATTDINDNLYISGLTNIYNNTTILSNLNVNNYVSLNSLTLNSSLFVSTDTLLNNISINSNLFIVGNTNIYNYSTFLSSLYVSADSNILFDSTILSNLFVNNYTNINGNTTIYSSLNISNNSLISRYLNILGDLNLSEDTIINNNMTILSSILINGYSNILGNCTINSTLNVSGVCDLYNDLYGNSNINIVGNTCINNAVTLGSLLNIININGPIICKLNDFLTNDDAYTNNVPSWGFYRTGGIVKICINQNPPIIYLSGPSLININYSDSFIDPGAYCIDFTDGIINQIYLSIVTGNTNVLSNFLITEPNTLITFANTLSIGNYTATYSATNSIGLIGYNNRSFNIN
jgi:NDP-sugar pyrophosphorylase family protein